MSIPHLSLDREAIVEQFIKDYLKTKYKVPEQDIAKIFKEEKEPPTKPTLLPKTIIPATIFNETLSPLEAIVKYLKEAKQMRLVDIAKLTGRDQRAIGVTYKAATNKMPQQFTFEKEEYTIPADLLQDKKLTVSEHVVKHLKETYHLNYHEIAVITKRNDRTIWTLYNRAVKKQ